MKLSERDCEVWRTFSTVNLYSWVVYFQSHFLLSADLSYDLRIVMIRPRPSFFCLFTNSLFQSPDVLPNMQRRFAEEHKITSPFSFYGDEVTASPLENSAR